MPLYEYECQACKDRFEEIQKIDDPPVKTCPKCGGKTQRLISAPSIQFKGTGWYVTDYGKGSAGPRKPEKDPSSTTDKKPATSSSDSKKTDSKKSDAKK